VKTSDRLLARLRQILDLPHDVYLERTGASRGQISAGAWRWRVMRNGTFYTRHGGAVGSQETMGELLRARALAVVRQEDSGDYIVYVYAP
jgi:hypothetical protein